MTNVADSLKLLIGVCLLAILVVGCDQSANAPPGAPPPAPVQPPFAAPQTAAPAPAPVVPWTAAADPVPKNDRPPATARFPIEFQDSEINFPRAWPPLALVHQAKEMRVFDLRSGELLGTFAGTKARRPTVASADGMHLASFFGKDLTVLSPASDDSFTREFEQDRNFGPLIQVFFPGNNRVAAVQIGSAGAQVHVLDFRGTAVQTFRLGATGQGRLASMAVGVSGGGKYLAAIVGGTLTIHELASGKCVGTAPTPREFTDEFPVCRELVFSPDGTRLAAVMIHKQRELMLLEWDATEGGLSEVKVAPASVPGQENFSIEMDEHPLTFLADGSGWVVSGRLVWKRDAGFPEPNFWVDGDSRPRCLLDDDHVAVVASSGSNRSVLKVPRAGGTLAAANPLPDKPANKTPPSEPPVVWSVQADPATAPSDPQGVVMAGDVKQPLRFSCRPSPFAAATIGAEYVVFDWSNGREVSRMRAPDNAPLPIWDVSPDGRYLLVGAAAGGTIWPYHVIDTVNKAPVWYQSQGLDRDGRHLEFVNSKQILVSHLSASGLRRMAVGDVTRRQFEREFHTPSGTGAYLPGSQLVTPGGRYAVAAFQRELVILEIATGKLVGRVSLHHEGKEAEEVFAPAVTADCTRLRMLVSYADKLRLVECDLTTGNLTGRDVDGARFRSLAGSRNDSRSAAWMPNDAETLVYQQVAVQCSTGALAGPLGIAADAAVLPLPRNRFLLAQRDTNPANGAAVVPLAIQANAAEQFPALAADLRTSPIASNPQVTPTPTTPEPSQPRNKKPWVAAIDPAPAAVTPVKKLNFTIGDSNYFRFFAGDRPSGFTVVCDQSSGECTVVDLSTGKAVGKKHTLPKSGALATLDPSGSLLGYAFSPEIRRHLVRIVDLQNGAQTEFPLDGPFVNFEYLGFDAEQRLVGVVENDKRREVLIWSRKGTQAQRRFTLEEDRDGFGFRKIKCAISPGGKYLAAFSKNYLAVIDLLGSAPPQEAAVPFAPFLEKRGGIFNCEGICFSHDGKRLAAVYDRNDHGYIAIWELQTGDPVVFRPFRKSLKFRTPGPANDIDGLAWFPDGETLLYGGVALIDAATGCPYWLVDSPDWYLIRPITPTMLLAWTGVSNTELGWISLPADVAKARAVVRKTPAVTFPPLKQPDPAPAPFVPREIAGEPPLDPAQPHTGLKEITVSKPDGLQRAQRGAFSSNIVAVEQSRDYVSRHLDTSRDRTPDQKGALTPENEISLETFDLTTGKPLHQIAAPERTTLLDLSPDGSLLLTGESMVHSPGYSRLDVWSPQLGKHVLGWMPQPYRVDRSETVQWASFVDKKHVLAHYSDRLTMWRLPELQRVYTVPTTAPPALSPNRRFFVDCPSGIVRDALSGRGVLQLEGVPHGYYALRSAIWSPDGAVINGVLTSQHMHFVARWEVKTGKRFAQFAIPRVDFTNLATYGERGLLLYEHQLSHYLVDLEQRRIACTVPQPGVPVRAADGALWTAGLHVGDAGRPFRRIAEVEIPPGPSHTPQSLPLPKDTKLAVTVKSDLPNASDLRRRIEERVRAAGLTIDPTSKFALTFEANTDLMPDPLRPGATVPALTCRLSTVTTSGELIYEVIERRRHDDSSLFDAFEWFRAQGLPPHSFGGLEWRTQVRLSDLPSSK